MMASVPNFRDVGGHLTISRLKVRTGLVYRSDQLNPVSPEDLATIAGFRLRSVFDLRTDGEAQARPDSVPDGLQPVLLNVMADADTAAMAGLERLMQNPALANRELGGGKAERALERIYRGFVSWPSAQRAYRQLFLSLATPEHLPALFHCATGKDRTGWAAAAFLTLLGVPRDAIVEDFLRSNSYVLPRYTPAIDAFAAAGGDRAILMTIFGVKAESLHAAFDEMHARFGSIEGYFGEGLGIAGRGQDALRRIHLASA